MKASVGRRVLMLLENEPYPQDNRVRQEARTLAAAGYRVSVICPMEPGQPWREMLDGVRVYRFPAVEMQRGHVPDKRITIVRNGPDLNRRRPFVHAEE